MPNKAIFDKKNVLVIGGAGFIGSHLCDELIKTSKVICLDNFVSGDERNIDHLLAFSDFEFLRHDICEPLDLESFPELEKFRLKFQGIQEVYHLACPTSPKQFESQRMEILHANSKGMINALEIAVRYQSKFMHFSSSVVYGPRQAESRMVAEEDIGAVDMLGPRCSYDEGKRFAEAAVATYRDVRGLDAKIARVFRVYGPRMPQGEGHMIPDFVNSALDGKPLVVHGDEKFSSSFCYISDIIDGILKFMESDLPGPVNLGSDVLISITEIARKIVDILGSASRITYSPGLLFMTPLRVPNLTKARQELGWIPIITLEKGLQKTIDDLRASKNLKTLKGPGGV
jgi:UDP-glucuronate decarboxylase